MPIMKNLTQIVTNTQADGSLSVTITLFDQDGTPYVNGFQAPAGFNVAAKADTMANELNIQLAEDEFRAIVGL